MIPSIAIKPMVMVIPIINPTPFYSYRYMIAAFYYQSMKKEWRYIRTKGQKRFTNILRPVNQNGTNRGSVSFFKRKGKGYKLVYPRSYTGKIDPFEDSDVMFPQ